MIDAAMLSGHSITAPGMADSAGLARFRYTEFVPRVKRVSKRSMTDEHKAALAAGRTESRVVKAYLVALHTSRPTRGRKRTPESITRRLNEIDAQVAGADPLIRLNLYQERLNLRGELSALHDQTDLAALADDFASVAQSYSERRGISYAAWREAGVSAAVLRKAGIKRSM
jgi:hypothetical protein